MLPKGGKAGLAGSLSPMTVHSRPRLRSYRIGQRDSAPQLAYLS
jgi:hypothetical protein